MRSSRITIIISVLIIQGAARGGSGRLDPEVVRTPLYAAEGNAIVRHNSDRFNNRPLYCNQISGIVVAGDRPLARFGSGSTLNGTFIAALVRGGRAKWLHDFADVTSEYRADRIEWVLKDPAFGSTALTLEAVPPAEGAGVALRLQVADSLAGDQLIWAFGGAVKQEGGMLGGWDLTTGAWGLSREDRQRTLSRSFSPDDCRDNKVAVEGGRLLVARDSGSADVAVGLCDAASTIVVADAGAWTDPLKLLASAGKDDPLACAMIPVDGQRAIYWAMLAGSGKKEEAAPSSAEWVFAAGMKRAEEIEHRVVVDTPDPQLNVMVGISGAVTDGVFREGIFTHSGMRWGVPLLGWRTMFGGTCYGWHDRVKTQARLAIAHQIKESDRTVAKADPRYLLTSQAPDSRLFGKGRIDFHQPSHYDMQSQFFDQLVHAWRWTGDRELEDLLRPALELHLEYIHDCFDPNDTGLYESYANTWPTDDQWYNGGGTAEETAYAYTGEKAAAEMARRAGDEAAAKRHEARLAKIHKAFMEKLWSRDKQYVGGWVEQGGHERMHDDCWLYAIFCPIDAGMLGVEQSAQSLYFTEWGLERENMPYGGQRVWPSNWVPSKWSLREMWPGDDYHLALSYFQTGLADEGWNVLRGTFPCMAFYGPVPGDLGYPSGGTDFNDCASMFCRTVVEGLFGYRPNYPDGVVTIAPQLPSDWDDASIKTPDVSLDVGRDKLQVELAQPAALDIRLPVRARKVLAVTVNGQPAKWELLPGFGCSVAKIDVASAKSAMVEVRCEQPLPQYPAVAVEGNVGQKLELTARDATKVTEPAEPPTMVGYHLVKSIVEVGDAPQWRVFKVKVSDPDAEAADAARTFENSPAGATWDSVDLTRQLNADVRTIFQQKYLSPRPATCSLRLGTDGYSTWQMVLGKGSTPPTIDLSKVKGMLDRTSRLLTPQGIPFAPPGSDRNIAFTSMWDNWPRQVAIPVNRRGQAISLLLCGFTNPMQGRISNAEVRLRYADGVVEKVELFPPINFWSMCGFGGNDYDYKRDGFALPKGPPATVDLGENCRAILLNRRLRPDVALENVELETLSQEVIIGVMGASVMNPR
jgi:hypothetical protein